MNSKTEKWIDDINGLNAAEKDFVLFSFLGVLEYVTESENVDPHARRAIQKQTEKVIARAKEKPKSD